MHCQSIAVDSDVRRAVADLVAYAKYPGNWFRISRTRPSAVQPKDNPRLVITVDHYRCVFSFTISMATLFRRLEITALPDTLFNRLEAVEIARMFDFKGSPKEWFITDLSDNGVILAKEVNPFEISNDQQQ